MSFSILMDRILAHEGGYTLNPLDRGNWTSGKVGRGKLKGTKYGISAMAYPHLDIKNLTRGMAMDIYRESYYMCFETSVKGNAARYQLLDYAVNSGIRQAVKALQKAVGAKPDGIIGPETQMWAAMTGDVDIALLVLADRLEYMTNIRSWSTFGRGWAKRISTNLRFAAKDLNEFQYPDRTLHRSSMPH